jgi:hypothetical protein
MKAALVFDCLFCQGFQEILVVTVFIETGRPVVASLDDVPGYARDNQAGTARHVENLQSMNTANIMHGGPACICRSSGIVPVR